MINNKLNIHNNYKARVVNKNGDVLANGYAENTILDDFWNRIDSQSIYANALRVGTGSPLDGGSEIDPSKTTLYSPIGSSLGLTNRVVESQVSGQTRLSTLTATATIPANSTYVGDITEVGIYNGSGLMSLALFKDSEGVPISISKTSEDVMIIDITIYVSINYSEDLVFSKDIDRLSNSILSSGSMFYNRGLEVRADLTVLPVNMGATNGRLGGLLGGGSRGTIDKVSREFSMDKLRSNYDQGFPGLYNYITLEGMFSAPLPNATLFPAYTIDNLGVGTGDGVKTEFSCPIPEFTPNSDIIKLDGVPLIRGVDYTLSADNNSMGYASSFTSHKTYMTSDLKNDISALSYYSPYVGGTYGVNYKELIEYKNNIYVEGAFIFPVKPFKGGRGHLKLSYSNDGVIYNEILHLEGSVGDRWHEFDTPITAKYWEIDVYSDARRSNTPLISFGKKPTHLVFTEAPASGSEITITCEVDRPFKNEEFIIDRELTFKY